ncbi:transcription-repair coupling factor [Bdellovibrionota bacterium FG-2]
MQSFGIKEILTALDKPGSRVRVSGTTALVRAYLTLTFCRSLEYANPFVLMCKNEEATWETYSDFLALAPLFGLTPSDIVLFPSWEISPYSPVAPSLKSRYSRLAGLSSLLASSPVKIIITTLAAATQATLPFELFKRLTLLLRTGNSGPSRDDVILHLVKAGYLASDTVEDRGTYAVRGSLLDIFSPHLDEPIRIEFFGDEIERIRPFNPETQRTYPRTLSEVLLCPAREFILSPESQLVVREKIKTYCDDCDVSRAIRDPLLNLVREEIYPEHSDSWVPFCYTTPTSLLGYLPENTYFAWNDEQSCLQEWGSFIKSLQGESKICTERGLIIPPPEKLFLFSPEQTDTFFSQARIYFDPFLLEGQCDQNTREFSVNIETNIGPSADAATTLSYYEPLLKEWTKEGQTVLVFCLTDSKMDRFRFLLEERRVRCTLEPFISKNAITIMKGNISAGFRWPTEGLIVLSEEEILGTRHSKNKTTTNLSRSKKGGSSASKEWLGLQALADLAIGDTVVHQEHGVAKYQGIARLTLTGAPSDFVLLEYAGNDRLYIPVYRLNVIQKYAGSGTTITLDRLGNASFQKTKASVKEAVQRLAVNLVQLYAERKLRAGVVFPHRDSLFREFESTFPFEETPDQLTAIEDVLEDLHSGKVMDRLICGDVGYGKTEVAIRAAFRVVTEGKQVAVLVPTTLLALQHEQSFRARLSAFAIKADSLSRFKTSREQKEILAELAQGKMDIVIGTHRLLSKDIQFKDLGLLIIDEEHRFGVEHKEKLKALKTNTHVLTLTATPIPRTLNMAVSGLRDISLINTPPLDRLAIRTHVSRYDEPLIQKVIRSELARDGQVFFLHNKVSSIYSITKKLQALIPEARFSVAHGQMPEGELEKTMLDFYQKKSHVLVCTSIIESGLDVPSANTLIVNRADALGLAQLYQIRGRIGRGQQRAHAYLFIPQESPVSEEAKRRLEVIQRFAELGSGFHIASHDLEIRGGGNLLGPQQSGHIASVGLDLYLELLEEAVREIQGRPLSLQESSKEPEIKTPFPSFLSEDYIPDTHQRLSLYRRFSSAASFSTVDTYKDELLDRFGPLPAEAENLLWLIRIKILLKTNGIMSLTASSDKFILQSGPISTLDPARAIALVGTDVEKYRLLPESKFVVKVLTLSPRELCFQVESALDALRTL